MEGTKRYAKLKDGRTLVLTRTLFDFKIPDTTDMEAYKSDNGLGILRSMDRTPKWGPLLHVSVSHSTRYPTWHEILAIRDEFFPANKDCMMIMPKKGDYVNVHPNCFHVWQCPQEWNLL